MIKTKKNSNRTTFNIIKKKDMRTFFRAIIPYIQTIRGKIAVSFGILTILLILLTITSYINMRNLEKEITRISEHDIIVHDDVQNLLEQTGDIDSASLNYVLSGDMDALDPYEQSKKDVNTKLRELRKLLKHNPDQRTKVERIAHAYNFWLGGIDRVIEARQYNTQKDAIEQTKTSQTTFYMNKMKQEIQDLLQDETNTTKERIHLLHTTVLISQIVTVALSLFAVILSIIISMLLTKTIKSSVRKISQSILNIAYAGGDLTKRIEIKSNDELSNLAKDTNQLIDGIAKLVTDIASMAENVSSSSEQLLASSEETARTIQSIAETANEIASDSEQVSNQMSKSMSKMEILEKVVSILYDSAETVKKASLDMKISAEKGSDSVNNTSSKMKSIENIISNTTSTVETLGQKSAEITKMIKTITGIAKQTNLLALNAAIEASRAGEHGRGFAVVANEVRNLAEQSQRSADEVTKIVLSIQKEVNRIIDQNNEGVQAVLAGVQSSVETKQSLQIIQKQTNATTNVIIDMVSEIEKTKKLSIDVAESFEAVNQIAANTATNTEATASSSQEGSAAMEEVTAAASELSKQAEYLRELISNFKI